MSEILRVVGIKIDPKPAEQGGKKVENSLKRVKSSADKVKSALVGAFTVTAASAAVRAFAEYDQQLRNVATVAGATEAEFEKLNDTALELALGTRFNPQQVAEGMYSLASAGQSVNEQISTLPNVLNLAEAAQAQLGQTTELVVSSMAQFQIQAEDSQRVVDVFTASIANSATNVPRLQVAMANSGSTAKAMNQEFESSVAVLSILTTAFGNGEKAGTGYKTLLNQLATNGEKIGIVTADAAGNMRPLVDILEDIKEAGIPATELMKTFGTEAGPALAVLLEQGTEAIDTMTNSLMSSGQASDTAAKQLDTLQGDWDKLVSTLSVALIEAVDAIEPALRGLLQVITTVIEGIMTVAGTVEDAVSFAFGGAVSEMESFGKTSSQIREETDLLVESLKNVSAEQIKIELTKVRNEYNELSSQITEMESALETGALNEFFSGASVVGIERRKDALTGLKERMDELKQEYIDAFKSEEAAAKATKETEKSYQGVTKVVKLFSDGLKESNAKLKAQIEVIKGNKTALSDYLKEQAVSNAQTQEERDLIESLFDEQTRLNDERERAVDAVNAQSSAQEVFNQIMRDALSVSNQFFEAESLRTSQREAVQLLYDKELITFDQYVTAQKEITRQFNEESDAVNGLGDALNNTETAFGSFFDELENSFKKSWEKIQQEFKNNPLEASANFAYILPDILDSIENNDSSARAVNEVASQIPIPAIQAISSIISSIDSLFGGNLLGTNFATTGTGFNASLSSGGVDGGQYENQSRKRSFFRGTSRRTIDSDLDEQLVSTFEQIQQASIEVGAATATALGVGFVETLGHSIHQEFDKDGNQISSIVTDSMGRTYNEGIEQFADRVIADNQLAQVFKSIAEQGGDTAAFEALANTYRANSAELLEASQLFAQIQQDIVNGYNLLGDGSLASITAVIEQNSKVGEELVQTYARVSSATKVFDEALGLMGIEAIGARENIVQFAVDVSEAAGGVAQSQALWSSVFSSFYTEQELLAKQFEATQDSVTSLQNELGTNLTFDTFRQAFENALPTLSPEDVASWLKLGDALATSNSLAGQLANSSLQDAMEALTGLTDDLTASQQTLYDQLQNNRQSIDGLITAYDGSLSAEQAIADSLRTRYEMELEYIGQIQSASESIQSMLSGTRESIELSLLDDESKYDYFKERAEALADSLAAMTDPAQIEETISQINDYTNQAYGLLDEGQRESMAPEFLQFLDDIGITSNTRLGELENETISQTDQMLSRIEEMQAANVEAEAQNQAQFGSNVAAMQQAVEMMHAVVTNMSQIRFPVDVYYRDNYEVSNL